VPVDPTRTIDDVRDAVARSGDAMPTRQPPFYEVKGNAAWWIARYRAVGEALGLAGDDLARFLATVTEGHFRGDALHVVPDAPATLARLAARGVRLGVISNWDDTLPAILKEKGLARFFDTVVASTALGHAKPERAIFDYALGRIGAAAIESWHVGDDPRADALGAIDAGLGAVLLDPNGLYPKLEARGRRARALAHRGGRSPARWGVVTHTHGGPSLIDPADPWAVSTAETIAFLERASTKFAGVRSRFSKWAPGRAAWPAPWPIVGIWSSRSSPTPKPHRSLSPVGSRCCRWMRHRTRPSSPNWSGVPFELVVFGRSLHHIPNLDGAIALAARALGPGELIVLEEFAHDRADEATARWLFEGLAAEERAGRIRAGDPDDDAPPGNGLARWRHVFAHDPPLHGEHAMLDALRRGLPGFELAVEDAPYLYRWFEERATAPDPAYARRWLAAERNAIARGAIRAIGLRVIASQPVRASVAPGAGSR
jgi:FMN phosphatase YigB (HAD superfamily)